MNMVKYLISNLLGTAFIALLGIVVGTLISWIAGIFLPESMKPLITGFFFILFMLGVPGIWVLNWKRMKTMETVQELSQEDQLLAQYALSAYDEDRFMSPSRDASQPLLQHPLSDGDRMDSYHAQPDNDPVLRCRHTDSGDDLNGGGARTQASSDENVQKGPLIPAGWYPESAGSRVIRWWDGRQWTQHTARLESAIKPD